LGSSLKILILSGNSLTYVDHFSFQKLQSLQHLDLSGNSIFSLNQMAFSLASDSFNPSQALSSSSSSEDEEGGFFSRSNGMGSSNRSPLSLPQLEYLDLQANRLKKIPFESVQNLTSLKTLDLRSNLITVTSDMIDYKGKRLSLEQLRLDNNR